MKRVCLAISCVRDWRWLLPLERVDDVLNSIEVTRLTFIYIDQTSVRCSQWRFEDQNMNQLMRVFRSSERRHGRQIGWNYLRIFFNSNFLFSYSCQSNNVEVRSKRVEKSCDVSFELTDQIQS